LNIAVHYLSAADTVSALQKDFSECIGLSNTFLFVMYLNLQLISGTGLPSISSGLDDAYACRHIKVSAVEAMRCLFFGIGDDLNLTDAPAGGILSVPGMVGDYNPPLSAI
jgi:hypothetical protein